MPKDFFLLARVTETFTHLWHALFILKKKCVKQFFSLLNEAWRVFSFKFCAIKLEVLPYQKLDVDARSEKNCMQITLPDKPSKLLLKMSY